MKMKKHYKSGTKLVVLFVLSIILTTLLFLLIDETYIGSVIFDFTLAGILLILMFLFGGDEL